MIANQQGVQAYDKLLTSCCQGYDSFVTFEPMQIFYFRQIGNSLFPNDEYSPSIFLVFYFPFHPPPLGM